MNKDMTRTRPEDEQPPAREGFVECLCPRPISSVCGCAGRLAVERERGGARAAATVRDEAGARVCGERGEVRVYAFYRVGVRHIARVGD